MNKAFKAFFQQQSTFTGILAAVMFQIIFIVVWMTGYDGVTDRTGNLKIALVSEDPAFGIKIINNLKHSLPFQTEIVDDKEKALVKLNNREVHMLLVVPANFGKQLQTPGGKVALQYTLNESNPAMIRSIMQGVKENVTASVNKEVIATGIEAILINAKISGKQAQSISAGLSEKVTSDIMSINKVDGMANQMLPMALVLASFVGSMLMSMNLQQSSRIIGGSICKWKKFGVRVTINILSAIIIGAIGSSLVLALGGESASGVIKMWGFQTLFLVAFMFFSQVFVLLFGEKGMIFNIIFLSLQLVTSGAMVPRELLSKFYYDLSVFLPATYAVQGIMNLRFGGPTVSPDVWSLIIIAFVSLGVGTVAVMVRNEHMKPAHNGSTDEANLASKQQQTA